MDQKKTGSFLKELRKENGLTQEQAAEKLNISARTISRWETGAYMPDISMLVDIAELYDADVREIIDGERLDNMNSEVKAVAEKMADYSGNEKKDALGWIRKASLAMTIVSLLGTFVSFLKYSTIIRHLQELLETHLLSNTMFLLVLGSIVFPFCLTIISCMITLYTNGKLKAAEENKAVNNLFKVITIIAIILAILSLIFTPILARIEVVNENIRIFPM